MSSYRTEGIILKRTDSGESDRMLTIVSPTHGLITAKAKAVRFPTSKLGGFLDLYAHIDLALGEGKNIDIVTEAMPIHHFIHLRTNVTHALYAGYIAELVIKSMQQTEDHADVFRLVRDTFTVLNTNEPARFVLEAFRLSLLQSLGYGINLASCTTCAAALAQEKNYFTIEYDGFMCPTCRESITDSLRVGTPVQVSTLKMLRLMQSQPLAALQSIAIPEHVALEITELTENLIRFHLDVTLKSPAVLIRLKSRS